METILPSLGIYTVEQLDDAFHTHCLGFINSEHYRIIFDNMHRVLPSENNNC